MPTSNSRPNTASRNIKSVKKRSQCPYAIICLLSNTRRPYRFSKQFTTVEPTIYNLTEYWFTKDRSRIRELRVDSLAQMMNLGNVQPGGRYLVVDEASGLLIAALLDRLSGMCSVSDLLGMWK